MNDSDWRGFAADAARASILTAFEAIGLLVTNAAIRWNKERDKSMTPTDYTHAAQIIARFEGFQATAKWDVNAYRLGYGSDTEGPEAVRVTLGMSTTPARALANLALRVPVFEQKIIKQVGAAAWDAVATQDARGALLSFCYNYGDLTPTVAGLVAHKAPLSDIAVAVDARGVDNAGVNAGRRKAEAILIDPARGMT